MTFEQINLDESFLKIFQFGILDIYLLDFLEKTSMLSYRGKLRSSNS